MADFEKAGGVIAILGMALAAAGSAVRVALLGVAGLALLGVGVICWGMSGLIEKRVLFFRAGTRYSESYYVVEC